MPATTLVVPATDLQPGDHLVTVSGVVLKVSRDARHRVMWVTYSPVGADSNSILNGWWGFTEQLTIRRDTAEESTK